MRIYTYAKPVTIRYTEVRETVWYMNSIVCMRVFTYIHVGHAKALQARRLSVSSREVPHAPLTLFAQRMSVRSVGV